MKWIVTSIDTVFKGTEVVEAIKKSKYIPKSEVEALGAAYFMVNASNEGFFILSNTPPKKRDEFRIKHNIDIEEWNELI